MRLPWQSSPHEFRQGRNKSAHDGRGWGSRRVLRLIPPGLECASVGMWPTPLIGRMSCGQAEKAMTRSISARSATWLPGVETGGSKDRLLVRPDRDVHEQVERARRLRCLQPEVPHRCARLSVQLS